MKMAVLLWASLALALGYARGTVSSDENAPSLLLPWDVPSKYVVRAVAGVSCTRYDFDVEHTLEEVQVFIVQAVVSVPFKLYIHQLKQLASLINGAACTSSEADEKS